MELFTEHWALPPQLLIKQMKWPTDMPTSQSDGWNFSNDVLSSQMILVCVKLTNQPAHCLYHSKNICIIHVRHYSYSCARNAETGCGWWICFKQQNCSSGSKCWKPNNQSWQDWFLVRLLFPFGRCLPSLVSLCYTFSCVHMLLVPLPVLIRTPVLLDKDLTPVPLFNPS